MQRKKDQARPDSDAADGAGEARSDPKSTTKPMRNNTGAKAEISNDRNCTISVVPTLAPSMMASAGTRLTTPSAASEAVISPVAVLDCNSAVRPRPATNAVKRLRSALSGRSNCAPR